MRKKDQVQVGVYLFILNPIQGSLRGSIGPELKDSCEEINSPRVQGDTDQRPPLKKEPIQMKNQDLLSDIPRFRFLCLPLTSCVTLDKCLNY